MSTSPYNQYTGTKPPPLWLKIAGVVAAIFVMLGYAGWGLVKLAMTSQPRAIADRVGSGSNGQ